MKTSGVKLSEGVSYSFFIEKIVNVPESGDHFVLKGPEGRKYLVPAESYRSYGLVPGNEVVCRVDKINCKGEVFLEPENPFYIEKCRYQFEVVEYREVKGSRLREGRVMVVRVAGGEELPVPVPAGVSLPAPGEMVELLVLRISKGKLHLSTGNESTRSEHLEPDTYYDFVVDGIEKDIDGEEYFLVTDAAGVTHSIKRKYYEYYGLKEGVKFRGMIIKYREDGTRLIEPENPFYTPGQMLELVITRNERNTADGTYYIAATDRFGFKHELRTEKKIREQIAVCRIVMIRKGKPLLEPV
ncbi:MAG: hypothetical protein IH591_06450 [Bacteroidales bacterium]|nr:hypothetical protein [Bacteroidales bacterium]